MKWKAIYFNSNGSIDNKKKEDTKWYGPKSPYSPRQVKELIPFESDLVELVKNIKLVKNTFQEKLKEDIKLIKESNKTMTPTDKTSNMYRLIKEHYGQLIMNSITSTYEKAGENLMRNKEVIKRMKTNSPTNQSC